MQPWPVPGGCRSGWTIRAGRTRWPRSALTPRADLVVVGGGYTGLWTALRAKERDPGRDVVVLEAGRCGEAASGRNGGFAEPSLTHGFANGTARWPDEMPTLLRLGGENIDGLVDTVARYGIDCGLERTGELAVATREHEVAGVVEEAEQMRAAGLPVRLLDAEQTRARVASPTYLAALIRPRGGDGRARPARLGAAAGVPRPRRTPARAVAGRRHRA